MKSNDLQVKAKQSAKRAGRGIAAGRGKTAGRGTKGQNARSGGKRRPGFEGGQNPLYMRLPKLKGFTSKRTPAHEVTTMQLEKMGAKNIDHEALVKASVLSDKHTKVKIIVKGELSKALNVTLDGASAGAIKAIEKAGGSFKEQAAPKRPKKSAQPNDK